MPVKIEITADTALEVLTIGKELFGLVGVVGEASAPAAPARGRGKKAEAGEPAVVAVATTEAPAPSTGQAAPVDPFGESNAAPTAGSTAASPPAPTSSAGTAITASPSDGGITREALTAKLTEVIKAKSALTAKKALEEGTGIGSLSNMPPEKYAAAYAKLEEVLKS